MATDPIKKLKEAYRELLSAKKSITNIHTHSTDAALCFGCAGFSLEKLDRTMKGD